MNNFRKTISAICILAMSASLAGCGSAKAAESNKVKIGVLRTADSVPLYLADKEGLYKKHGLDAEVIEFGSASDQSKAAETGAIDIMMTDMVVPSIIEKGGTDMQVIATALGSEPSQGKMSVVAGVSGKVKEAADLEGSSVAISEGTFIEYLLDSYCEELGIDISKVEKVNIPSISLRYSVLMENGETDCAVLPDPMGDFAEMNGGIMVIDDTKLSGNYSVTVISANKKFTKKKETCEKFIKAYNEAVDLINGSPDEYKDFVLEKANVPDALVDKYVVPTYPKNSVPTQEEVERVENWMVDKGLLDKPYSYEDIVDNSFCVK